MPRKSKTPLAGGESQMSFNNAFKSKHRDEPLHRQAALALLSKTTDFTHKEARFLGQMTVTAMPSKKQRDWLNVLLVRDGLDPITYREGPR